MATGIGKATGDINSAFIFKTPTKQRVSDYLRQNPKGTYKHWLKVGYRAYQVSPTEFDEVYDTLQERGVLHPALDPNSPEYKAMEERIRAEVLEEFTRPIPSPAPAPESTTPKATEAAAPAPELPVQAPLTYPNESQTKKEPPMAKPELKIKQLSPEQRQKLDSILMKTPEIAYDDLMAKLETFTIPKTIFFSTRTSIRQGTYRFQGAGETSKPRGGAARKSAEGREVSRALNGNGHDLAVRPKLFNWYPIPAGQIEIIKRIDYEGYKEEDLKAIQRLFPSILSEIFGTKAAFKFFKISEDDGEGNEIKMLELRRIS